jgi:transcriptional regulator with XRE-family HTH domain
MSTAKLIAGHAVRRLRRQQGLSQAAMAEMLDISPSYLNLIERNQRPLSAKVLVRVLNTKAAALRGAAAAVAVALGTFALGRTPGDLSAPGAGECAGGRGAAADVVVVFFSSFLGGAPWPSSFFSSFLEIYLLIKKN